MPNLAKIKKERLKNDIRIGIRIHPYSGPSANKKILGVKRTLGVQSSSPSATQKTLGDSD